MADIRFRKILQLTEFNDRYRDILNRYYRLVCLEELSEFDNKSLDKILEKAETDLTLSFLLNKVDEITFEKLGFYEKDSLAQVKQQQQKAKQLIEKLLDSKNHSSNLSSNHSNRIKRVRKYKRLIYSSLATASFIFIAFPLRSFFHKGGVYLFNRVNYQQISKSSNSDRDINREFHDAKFFCDSWQGIPTTVVKLSNETVIPLIPWKSNYVGSSLDNSQAICQENSRQIQRLYFAGILKYLTTGILNGETVICVAKEEYGDCVENLFAINSDINASQVLYDISNNSMRIDRENRKSNNIQALEQ